MVFSLLGVRPRAAARPVVRRARRVSQRRGVGESWYERIARRAIRRRHPHDANNFREIFERDACGARRESSGAYWKRGYMAGGSRCALGVRVREGSVVLDCGAFVGFFALRALECGARRVECVEPNPVSAARLRRNLREFVASGRVRVHEVALVATGCAGEVHVADRGYRSRVAAVGGAGTTAVRGVELGEFLGGADPPVFVKMDVEGAEGPLLEDASVRWGAVEQLVFEYTRGSDRLGAIKASLQRHGFSAHSWRPSVFTPLPRSVTNRDEVLHCVRSPGAMGVLEVLRTLPWEGRGCLDPRVTFGTGEFASSSNELKSFTFGYKLRGGAGLTAATLEHGAVARAVVGWARSAVREDMLFSSVMVLRNSRCPVHCDRGNVGPSAMVTWGRHEGGALWSSTGAGGRLLECHNTVHYFDGRVPHATMDFSGERFSLVIYQRSHASAAPARLRADLEAVGFRPGPFGPVAREEETASRVPPARAEMTAFLERWAGLTASERWRARASPDV